ncbi:MAG: threonine--tRNA ligase [archaeon]|nr:threonine--tRNA ligase [archaeon]
MAIDWNLKEEKEKFWHSSAHIMAAAVIQLFKDAKPTIGPPIDEGFYYDFDVKKPFTPEDFEKIEKKVAELVKKNDKFERQEISKKEALELFKNNKYKTEIIEELPEGEKISVYRSGDFLDLCRGPHIGYTSAIKAFKILKTSSAYWRGDAKKEALQRIYAISFPKKEMLEEFVKQKEEAEKRNHLKLGKELDLFSMQGEAPGTVFFHAKGTILWNELTDFAREEQRKRNYKEVITPIILKKELWLKSGHWDHYKENMYFTKIDGEEYAIKPMNCPGHTLIYSNKRHSYRDLPIRMGEFGMVHRHELSGVLNGLFRVRKFTQDDTHIFCTPEQIENEIKELLEMIAHYYKTFGFEYKIELSTKPEKAMGSQEVWDKAEKALKNALEATKTEYKLNEGDGAFYGPKIDFHIKDSLGRNWQLGTIQLDFQMPEKFDLKYIDTKDKEARPVMIHRAIFGSMERFIGILIEHYAGFFPLWLAPLQVKIVPVSEKFTDYAKKVNTTFIENGIRSEIDIRTETVSYRVREAQLEKVFYIINVGENEEKAKTIAVRNREGKVEFGIKLDKFVEKMKKEILEKK